MPPPWLHALAIVSLALSAASALAIVLDLLRRPQPMGVMNVTWPITALYFGPLGVWAYSAMGRAPPPGGYEHRHEHSKKPFWQQTFVGTTHCGGGCTLGDVIAEFGVFFAGVTLAGSIFAAELVGDFVLAFLLGIAFQYFAIAPMRGLSPGEGIAAAVKADALSLTAFEIGLFGWMALMRFVFFTPPLHPNQVEYWFMMQVGMLVGFATSYPANWWLVRTGVKEAM